MRFQPFGWLWLTFLFPPAKADHLCMRFPVTKVAKALSLDIIKSNGGGLAGDREAVETFRAAAVSVGSQAAQDRVTGLQLDTFPQFQKVGTLLEGKMAHEGCYKSAAHRQVEVSMKSRGVHVSWWPLLLLEA